MKKSKAYAQNEILRIALTNYYIDMVQSAEMFSRMSDEEYLALRSPNKLSREKRVVECKQQSELCKELMITLGVW